MGQGFGKLRSFGGITMSRYLMTHSLLSAWNWLLDPMAGARDKDKTPMDEFLQTLYREKTEPTEAMLKGREFEDLVNTVSKGGAIDPEHKWAKPATQIGNRIKGAELQVKISRELEIDGVTFLCYGILDALQAGTITDVKYSESYRVNKFLESSQHPMYFYLCPEAIKFEYLISDGRDVFTEKYLPAETPGIEKQISEFYRWMVRANVDDVYRKYWEAR
jgi:hypothetical protein